MKEHVECETQSLGGKKEEKESKMGNHTHLIGVVYNSSDITSSK